MRLPSETPARGLPHPQPSHEQCNGSVLGHVGQQFDDLSDRERLYVRPLREAAQIRAGRALLAPSFVCNSSPHPICPIISPANSEHLISFAPSISRAKSYVTVLAAIARSKPFTIKAAASPQPMYSNIITPDRITEPGFTLS